MSMYSMPICTILGSLNCLLFSEGTNHLLGHIADNTRANQLPALRVLPPPIPCFAQLGQPAIHLSLLVLLAILNLEKQKYHSSNGI